MTISIQEFQKEVRNHIGSFQKRYITNPRKKFQSSRGEGNHTKNVLNLYRLHGEGVLLISSMV